MTRLFGHPLAAQMLLLWLVESLIAFFLLLAMLSGSTPAAASVAQVQIAAALTALLGLAAAATGLYRPEALLRTRTLLMQVVVSAMISLPFVWQVGKAVHVEFGALFGWSTTWPVDMLVLWTALLLASRMLWSRVVGREAFARPLQVVAGPADAARFATALRDQEDSHFRIAGVLPALAAPPAAAANRPWAIVLGPEAAADPAAVQAWRRQGVRVLSQSEFCETHLCRIDMAGETAGALPAFSSAAFSDGLRRAFDIVVAVALLALTLPLMLLTAALVKIESKGPVLYRQERVGQHGGIFTLAKFRSMRIDAEAAGPVWATRGDRRVTRVGGFIRKVRIDELPQLFNVLSGEMSLIGPRPERPHFVSQLSRQIPHFAERTRVKPGVTGWAQVNYPYGASVDDARAKLSFDLYYVKHRSLVLDVMILFATIRVVLFQVGAR